jgi:hypothetical protein
MNALNSFSGPASRSDLPPISNLLLQEAEAWRAVLSLHSSVASSAQQVSRAAESTADVGVLHELDDRQLQSESREAAYCSALTSLASQCDALSTEALKLRLFRKARRSVEVQCARELVRAHVDETLAIGKTLSTNGALCLASLTTELRIAIQTQQNQIEQLRSLLEAIASSQCLPLAKDARIVVGVESVEKTDLRGVDEVLQHVYSSSRELSSDSLSDTLRSLFLSISSPTPAPSPAREFTRTMRGCREERNDSTARPNTVGEK